MNTLENASMIPKIEYIIMIRMLQLCRALPASLLEATEDVQPHRVDTKVV